MSTFFDNDDEDEDSLPELPPPLASSRYPSGANADASSSRTHDRSSSAGSRSFLSRLETNASTFDRDERDLVLEQGSSLGEPRDLSLGDADEGEGEGEDENEDELEDVKRMTRVWVRERATVEIMNWQGDLVDSLFDKLEQQVG